MTIGISKKELMECYYPDEIPLIFEEYNRIHGGEKEETETISGNNSETLDPLAFFGIK